MVALIVHFSFDKEVPAEQQALGRRKSVFGVEYVIDFSLDGPGGERIEIIKMDHVFPLHHHEGREGFITRCKVYNIPVLDFVLVERYSHCHPPSFTQTAGVSCLLLGPRKHKRESTIGRTKVKAATGTVITGLYAT